MVLATSECESKINFWLPSTCYFINNFSYCGVKKKLLELPIQGMNGTMFWMIWSYWNMLGTERLHALVKSSAKTIISSSFLFDKGGWNGRLLWSHFHGFCKCDKLRCLYQISFQIFSSCIVSLPFLFYFWASYWTNVSHCVKWLSFFRRGLPANFLGEWSETTIYSLLVAVFIKPHHATGNKNSLYVGTY